MRLPPPSAAFGKAAQHGVAVLASCLVLLSPPTPHLAPCASAAPPTEEAQVNLKKGFNAAQLGLTSADALLSASIDEWERTNQPADETAAIYKTRGMVREQNQQLPAARADLTRALELLARPDAAAADPGEVQRTLALRAGVEANTGDFRAAAADLTEAIKRLAQLDAIEATNPFLYSKRAAALARVGEFAPAADDAEQAELEFKEIGDRIRTVLSAADGALSLYGVPGREEDAVAKTIQVFRSKGSPATNNPDDIALLQELSRKDAELHLAYAADLRARGEGARARTQWESGCIRLEAYRRDGVERLQQEAALRAKESALGPGAVLKAESVTTPQAKFTNSDFNARLLGLDPKSPYVTQRPNQNYFWYSTGEAQVERRDPGIQLATVDESLSCDAFRESAWVDANRPEWPPALRTKLAAYAVAEPRVDFVMPPKGSPPSKGELVF